MIDHLVEERGLSREQAYILSSVAVDLSISEIVDAPNWIVSASLPESIFVRRLIKAHAASGALGRSST